MCGLIIIYYNGFVPMQTMLHTHIVYFACTI